MSQELLTVVTRKGQITVPARIRRALGLSEGDRVAVSIRDESAGEAVLRPVRSVAEATYGVATSRGEPGDIDAMREQFEQGLAEDAMRGLMPPDRTT